ncbi:MAG TPA: DUF4270 family protein [Chitinophagaceae bacterium]|jgi:hypothetical protein
MNLSVVRKQFALFLLLLVFFFSACTKIVTTDIGTGLVPPVDSVITKEMYLDIVSKNIKDTFTRVATGDVHSLGYVDDPLFGKTTASISVQLKPTSFPFYFPGAKDSLSIDSTILILSYKGVWGDSSKPLAFRVYDILQDGLPSDVNLKPDTAYPTNHIVPRGNELTENKAPKYVYPNRLNDSVKPDPLFEQASHQLRITLDKSYGDRLLHNYDSTTAYKNDSLFDLAFKGYQIVPEATGNSLLKINLLDTNTKLAIYFKYPGDSGKTVTAVRYFRCNQYTCGSTNYIQHNRSGKEVESFLPPVSDGKINDSLIFIDANPGIYARLQIPTLDSGKLPNMIIHRAEILMEQAPDLTYNSDMYLTSPNLFITPFSNDSLRRFALPNDVQLSSGFISNQSLFGCYPSKKTDPSSGKQISKYSFDISRYVQGIITRHEKSYPLILYGPSVRDFVYITETSPITVFTGVVSSSDNSFVPLNAPAAGRVRLGGASNSTHKMRLHIVYSEL